MSGRKWLIAMWVFMALFALWNIPADLYGIGHAWPFLGFAIFGIGFTICAIVAFVKAKP